MRERWTRKDFILVGLAASSPLATLIGFFFEGPDQFFTSIRTNLDSIAVIFFILAWIITAGSLSWLTARYVDHWRQRRRDSRKLKDLTKQIALAKESTYSRIAKTGSSETLGVLLDAAAISQSDLRKELTELEIAHPAIPTNPSTSEIVHWAVYLDVLLPLAVVGDIDEARMVLARIEEQEGSET